MKRSTVTRYAVVLHEDGRDWDADGGYLTRESAESVIPYLAESHGWDPDNMTVEPREEEVCK